VKVAAPAVALNTNSSGDCQLVGLRSNPREVWYAAEPELWQAYRLAFHGETFAVVAGCASATADCQPIALSLNDAACTEF
jgi:hypothetical protein